MRLYAYKWAQTCVKPNKQTDRLYMHIHSAISCQLNLNIPTVPPILNSIPPRETEKSCKIGMKKLDNESKKRALSCTKLKLLIFFS